MQLPLSECHHQMVSLLDPCVEVPIPKCMPRRPPLTSHSRSRVREVYAYMRIRWRRPCLAVSKFTASIVTAPRDASLVSTSSSGSQCVAFRRRSMCSLTPRGQEIYDTTPALFRCHQQAADHRASWPTACHLQRLRLGQLLCRCHRRSASRRRAYVQVTNHSEPPSDASHAIDEPTSGNSSKDANLDISRSR